MSPLFANLLADGDWFCFINISVRMVFPDGALWRLILEFALYMIKILINLPQF